MRGSIVRFIDALKRRREESEEGFSLIELIVVVAILGILVAIAIPVFGNIQQQAAVSALKTVASNGATQVAAAIATDPTATVKTADLANLQTKKADGSADISVSLSADVTTANVGSFCVTATQTGVDSQKSGPGC